MQSQRRPLHFSLLLLPTLVLLTSCDYFSARILRKPVVQVENITLNAEDFSAELAQRLRELDALSAKDPQILAVLKQQLINDFIVASLVDLWISEKKIPLGQAEIESELKSFISTYPSDSAFREALDRSGQSYAQWSKKVTQGLKLKKLQSELAQTIAPPSEAELQAHYQNNSDFCTQKEAAFLQHIQVSDENQAEIVRKLLRQQPFSDVAKKYSSSYSADSQDSYGWVEKEYAGDLEKVFRARPGDIVGPVAQAGSFHLFRVKEKRQARRRSFAECRADVLKDVLSLREKAALTSWLDGQMKKYKIKKNSGMLDSIHVETK